MPEGHTLHRLAQEQTASFAGRPVRVSSPQGRFAAGAALLDGRVLDRVRAHGKHLLASFGGDILHVHLGLYGTYTRGTGSPPVPRGADAHYVYRRTGLPCRVCGTAVRTEVMAGRNLYWCPVCQLG